MSEVTTLPPRSEVPVEETWETYSVFDSDQAWKKAYREVEEQLPHLASFQGRLGTNPETLADWFDALEKVEFTTGKILVYAHSFFSVDTSDQDAAARYGQARSLATRVAATTAFARPEMMAIGFDKLNQWGQENPRLAHMHHHFEKLHKRKDHIRSGEVEEVLAMASDPMDNNTVTYNALTNADLRFEPAIGEDGSQHEVGQSSFDALFSHGDRQVRRTAWENYQDGYLTFKNTLANCLISAVKRDVFHMRARKFDSSLEAALSPHHIPVEVFHNLLGVFKKNLPTWHRYWQVRREALGYDELHVYDIKAPLVDQPPQVSFEQAVAWISEGMAPLGDVYVDPLREGVLEERWVDYALNKGKQEGAFSTGVQGTHPFILMSYTGDLYSLSTLAHELGHSLHSYFTWQTQPHVYADYSIFVAEVASNFNQALVRHYLFETQDDPDFQIALIEEAMSNFHRYFFIMPTLARFELAMHERIENDEPVNAQIMIDMMADLFQEGYGEHLVAERDRSGITWAQFQHLYQNFYVFQYATGISGAHALADRVLEGENGATEDYLNFLRSGSSKYPREALKEAGVDLTKPAPVEKAFATLSDLVDRLERLIS